jgi:hypothetical protein
MRGNVVARVSAVLFVAVVTSTASLAQQAAPKAVPAEAARPADPDAVNAPDQLRSKSVIIGYFETRNARPAGGGKAETRRVPFTLTVYINKDKHAFNRLAPGRSGASSDQVRGAKDEKGSAASKDITGFATRDVVFDGLKMTVANKFGAPAKGGGRGSREISATFDETFTKCTGNVVTTIEGEYARRRLMKGGFEELLSATNDGFTCTVMDGNALATGS